MHLATHWKSEVSYMNSGKKNHGKTSASHYCKKMASRESRRNSKVFVAEALSEIK